MCQSKNDGGKRCAQHHPHTLAVVRLVAEITGTPQPVVQQYFTDLRTIHRHSDTPLAANSDDLNDFTFEARDLSDSDEALVEDIITGDYPQDADEHTIYALQALPAAILERDEKTHEALSQLAHGFGITPTTFTAEYKKEHSAVAYTKKKNINPEEHADAQQTWKALAPLTDLDGAHNDDASKIALTRVFRRHMKTLPPLPSPTQWEGERVEHAVGDATITYDPATRNLHTVYRTPDGEISGVTPDVSPQWVQKYVHTATPTTAITSLRRITATYDTPAAGNLATRVRRCATCGRFLGAASHTCATMNTTTPVALPDLPEDTLGALYETLSDSGGFVLPDLPEDDITPTSATLDDGNVDFVLPDLDELPNFGDADDPWGEADAFEDFANITFDPEADNEYDIDAEKYEKVQQQQEVIAGWEAHRKALISTPEGQRRAADTALYYAARDSIERDYPMSPEDTQYIIQEAVNKFTNKEQHLALPDKPVAGEITGGICDPNIPGSRRFGLEIEFDLIGGGVEQGTPVMKEKILAIEKDLADAGIIPQPDDTHTRTDTHPFAPKPDGWEHWSLVYDPTVTGGELVTSPLSDTPENWEKINTALNILKRHRAITTQNTGGHINISTGSFQDSQAKTMEAHRIMAEHQETLFRAAATPHKNRKPAAHRGSDYCAPTNIIHHSITATENNAPHPEIGTLLSAKNSAVNLKNANIGWDSRAEYRLWDGALDLHTIQARVAVSAAMTDTADLNIRGDNTTRHRETRNEVGHTARALEHAGQDATTITPEALQNVTDFVNEVFPRDRQREWFLQMFAVNQWAKKQ